MPGQQKSGQAADFDFDEDDDEDDLTEEQKKAKRIMDLKKKHTLVVGVPGQKKKVPVKKPNAPGTQASNQNINEDSLEQLEESFEDEDGFVPPDI